jgi:hypothetical protein
MIYALVDPRTGEDRYVGKTSKALAVRLREHLGDARRRKFESLPRFRWINALALDGLAPLIRCLDTCGDEWQPVEMLWIKRLRAAGATLLNCTDGGEGITGCKLSEQTRQRISESAVKRYKDPVRRAELMAMGEKAKTASSRAKLSASLRSTFSKPEVRARLSAAQIIASQNPEKLAKLSAAMKGRVFSESHCAKLSAAAQSREVSQEARAAMSAARLGRKHSEETKRKMREAITPEMRSASAERLRIAALARTPEERAEISERMTKLWAERRAEKTWLRA